MRISDWSSDVCSSDLASGRHFGLSVGLVGAPIAFGHGSLLAVQASEGTAVCAASKPEREFAAGIYGRRKTNIQPYQSVIVSMHEPRDQTEQRLAMQNRSRETHFLRLPRIDMQGIAITEMAEKVGQVQRDANLLALRCRLRWHLPIQHPAKSAAPPIIPGTKLLPYSTNRILCHDIGYRQDPGTLFAMFGQRRSEERRVGKECVIQCRSLVAR